MLRQKLFSLAFVPLFIFPGLLPGEPALPWQASPTPSPAPVLQTGLLEHGDRSKPEVALTFDADMTPAMEWMLDTKKVTSWYDPDIISTLIKTHTPATLFLTGMWAQLYPEVTKQLATSDLFEIGNHSYSHPSFAGKCYTLQIAGPSSLPDQIKKTQEVLQRLTGITPTLFRFPGGCLTEQDLQIVSDAHLESVGWDVVSGDAFNDNTESIINTVLSETHDGSIIIMHMMGSPNAPKTGEALPKIINGLKEKGYQFVTVSQLLSETPPELPVSLQPLHITEQEQE